MDLEKYFMDEQDYVNDNFYGFDGGNDEFGFVEDYSFDGGADVEYHMATGGGSKVPTSQPYIISIQNTSTASAYPATILGANETLGYTSPNWQNSAAISITMGISGVTYRELLEQSKTKPFTVSGIMIQSSNTNQITKVLTITQKDVNGNVFSQPVVPQYDPYQNLNNVLYQEFKFLVDGQASVVISSVLASTTVTYSLYPSDTMSTARVLAGRRPQRMYKSPEIVKTQKLSLDSQALRELKG